MKHRVSELEGALLDAAVAKAEGWRKSKTDSTAWWPPGKDAIPASITEKGIRDDYGFRPSSHWQHGGPIIERERMDLSFYVGRGGWDAMLCTPEGCWRYQPDGRTIAEGSGSTPLIAAMRAYAASKFGEEVELP